MGDGDPQPGLARGQSLRSGAMRDQATIETAELLRRAEVFTPGQSPDP